MKKLLLLNFHILFGFSIYSQEVIAPPPKYPDAIYTKENTRTRRAIPYPTLREADVMWSKRVWRVIDLREKMNHPLYFPTEVILNRKSLFDVIKDAAINDGTITCFDNPLDEEFRYEMSKSDVEKLLSRWDSTAVTDDPNNPGATIAAPQQIKIESSGITKYRVKEDWFFDKQRSVLDVRILGLLVLKEKTTESGDKLGADEPLFWIYFPEARPVFANQEVYMRHNDSERRTFEDIFWKRMFSSYVIKETNVYDRYISSYALNLDALLEAERVKKDIFTFEHDLWHF